MKKNRLCSTCYCGSGKPYPDCCGRYLDANEIPANAEILMRSRYTAYLLSREDYLLATWHHSKRPPALNLAQSVNKWVKLAVKRYESESADRAIVEFVAYYKVSGRMCRLHETSSFVRENDRWFYLDDVVNC